MAASAPTSKVELRISCKGLTNKDTFSKSDPQVFVYCSLPGQQPRLMGKTEKINNSLNPQFNTAVFVDYYFELTQHLKFVVMDVDNDILDNEDDLIGRAECTLATIVSAPGATVQMQLMSKHMHKAGLITVKSEVTSGSKQKIRFIVDGHKLDKKDLFGKSDPYFTLSKRSNEGFSQVYKSEIIKNTLEPHYKQVILPMDDLTGGDIRRELLFNFYDYDSVGSHDFIGSFITTAEYILANANNKATFDLINQKKKEKKSSYHNSGTIAISNAVMYRDSEFIDYLFGGCEIQLTVAIDCTASNLSPSSPSSLHYKHPTDPNPYANAIVSVGNVLAPYDFDGLIPTYGFGAIVPHKNSTSHCFPMNLTMDPKARGVEGVLDTYYQNIALVDFSGPTCFAPIIEEVRKQSECTQANQRYTILMIITDGAINDMEETIRVIVRAANNNPMSIIIVGVGNANFDSMVELDSDGKRLSDGVHEAKRDIVQFVAMSDFKDKPFYMLAQEVLKEVPTQFMQYMNTASVFANPPRVFVAPPTPMASVPMVGVPVVGVPVAGAPVVAAPMAPVSVIDPTTLPLPPAPGVAVAPLPAGATGVPVVPATGSSSVSGVVDLDKHSPVEIANATVSSPTTSSSGTIDLEKHSPPVESMSNLTVSPTTTSTTSGSGSSSAIDLEKKVTLEKHP
ncbi:hypothetical protein SAMD00019534_029290 [Acytostelium subglobosum LB1]|uniref:hypothetical protein n=1 Tax=Acytostelium subglobosum LB1 TaxID=1410327 RepID=UPI000644B1FB|nr:hypothetical protein SAMD00019534_029290 [Acytostelium subglobosum LB1]GAM19754.1 hypothetical protein SAMD00019534_029290 [Acytostelium subglobosum LB1]|eukprot:XP_012756516.1 hypothetical protein SAMD00019534_029290 [Acytostelium subglobosum LB1]